MKTTLLTLAVAVALGTVAGCDRNAEQRAPSSPTTTTPSAPAGSGGTATQQSNTPSTPANIGSGKEHAQPPVQGREDVRQSEQRKDFEHKGDGAGPKPGG